MKTITTTVLLGALLATAATPRAQEARDPKSMIPANAMVVGWSSGPGALADAFGETRLAELLGGPELGGMIGLAMMQLRAAIAEKAADIDPDELSDALTGYKGKVYFAMGADLDKVDMMAGPDALADASPWMAMIAASDGQSDLAAFQKRLSGVIEDSAPDDRFRDLEVEGRNYRVGGDDEMSATLPFMTGGHLVMVAGADLEESVVRCLGPDGRSLASTQATLPGGEVGVWMNLSPLWTMLSRPRPTPTRSPPTCWRRSGSSR